jgi:hypothetical protein
MKAAALRVPSHMATRVPDDVVGIPIHWRARDIDAEMGREGIHAPRALVEHMGALVEFVDNPAASDHRDPP